MITIKNEEELKIMKKSGEIAASVMYKVLGATIPEVSKAALDKLALKEIKRLGGSPSFTTVPGYHWVTCITVGEEVVHGVPNDYILKQGDLVSVDLGVRLLGFHTDMARTIYLGNPDSEIKKFMIAGETALRLAIAQAQPGNRIFHISTVIQKTVEGAGYSIVRELTGHGIGKKLHEDPAVPGFVTKDSDIELKVGMTLAIEVIYTMGEGSVVMAGSDGWTIASKDGSLAGLFEDTVAITKTGPVVLTKKD